MIDEQLLSRFERALGLDPAARRRFLEDLERDDPTAARELRSLLEAEGAGPSVFERPSFSTHDAPPPTAVARAALASAPAPLPDRIGPYRIVREIGRGGMGRVFLGEQVGDGFKRPVAVKRLDRGEPSPLALRRFRDETRILATLDHPGIARFLDGGRDAAGFEYLALEYVEGVDLIAHATKLGLTDRLRLFLGVLEAVDFAHRRHVVHRDLKPGNILVGADGRPKLLDFGISKLIDPGTVDATATRTDQRAFTPAYASPEQIAGGVVTGASDIFSLGVILYELIADERPFERYSGDPRGLESAILERDPDPPSTAARRGSRGKEATAAGIRFFRSSGVGRDLDAICLRALRKEPEARYGSVRALADDLERLLGGRAVAARRGGAAYRLGKRIRRYRGTLLAATAAAVVAALVVLFVMRSPELVAAPPAPRATLPPIGELSARFAALPNRPELGLALVRAYLDAGRGADAMGAVSRLRQIPGEGGRGARIDLAEAEAALAVSEYQRAAATAVAAREAAEGDGESDLARRAKLLHARTLIRLASPADAERALAELVDDAVASGDAEVVAEALVARADAARRGANASEVPELLDAGLRKARELGLVRVEIEALILSARLEGDGGRIEEGLSTLDRALGLARDVGWLAGEASALLLRSALLNWKGEASAALEAAELAAERLRETGSREQLLMTLGNVALARIERGELDEADVAIREAEALLPVLTTTRARAQVLRARAYLQEMRGDVPGSRAAYRAAIAAARESASRSALAVFLRDLAWLELSVDQFADAEALAREAVELFEEGGDERSAVEAGAVVACAAAARGEVAAARRQIERLRSAAESSDSISARYVVEIARAKVHEVLGELEAAIALRREIVRIADGFDTPALALVQRLRLAQALDRAGREGEARELARAILPGLDRIGMVAGVRDCEELLAGPG